MIIRRLVLSYRVCTVWYTFGPARPVKRRVVDVLHLTKVLHRMVDVLHLAEVLHLAVDVVALRRNVLQPDRLPTCLSPDHSANYDVSDSHYSRRRSLWTSGHFPQLGEYAYAALTVQSSVPTTFQEAMKLPDAELWNAAFNKEIKSLQDLTVFKLVPRSAVPPGHRIYKSKPVTKPKPDNTRKARLVAQGWN